MHIAYLPSVRSGMIFDSQWAKTISVFQSWLQEGSLIFTFSDFTLTQVSETSCIIVGGVSNYRNSCNDTFIGTIDDADDNDIRVSWRKIAPPRKTDMVMLHLHYQTIYISYQGVG